MSNGTTSIQAKADAIVAQDVAQGRPGKPAAAAQPKPGCGWPLFLVLVVLFGAGAGFGISDLLGIGSKTAAGTQTSPDNPVPVNAQQPDMTTVAANPMYNGPAFGVIQFTCNGNLRPYPVTGPLMLGGGMLHLQPQQTSPFNGTLTPTFMVNATGDSGTLTGTLVNGNNQTLMLVTQDTFFPCVGGPFPFIFQIQSDLNLAPMVTKGLSVADQIAAQVLIANTRYCPFCGEPIFPWWLFALFLGTGLVSSTAFSLWWWHYKLRRTFGDDDYYSPAPRRGFRGDFPL
jgi:hypothetical protein